jgi:protein-S-isoprenylcysteine O-methyltransferase Ste14
MGRVGALLYGVICYMIFVGTFVYAMGFVTNLFVPTSIDSPARSALGHALLVNIALLGVFALQHSGMARQGFKKVWTRYVPEPLERSTYVLFTSVALLLMFWLWEPMGGIVWEVDNPTGRAVLTALSLMGFGMVLISTFLINHFDLFGLRQVYLFACNETYEPLGFRTPGLYHFVRHPIYLGFLIAFWAAPTMTVAHFVFAVVTAAYILIAIQLEERDLVHAYGSTYHAYRHRVSMLVPLPPRNEPAPAPKRQRVTIG